MRFIDEAIITVSGGHGGPGSVSFRRETFIPRGGPDGGDGGEGGDVIFVASDQLSSLQDFRYKREYKAPSGSYGSGANKAGRDGVDIELKVPTGTVIKDADTDEVIIDMSTEGERWVAAQGGRGGKGNAHFVSSTFQAPKFAQPGEEGTSRRLKLELKLLADVAIVGFPNAGKSTLISRISAARPKVADYAFTTLVPNLGVVSMPDLSTFVVADIPGLIEGAHRGMGLGHKFLKHIERTRLFVHLLDGSAFLEDATQPTFDEHGVHSDDKSFDRAIEKLIDRYQIIRNELGLFSEALLHKPELVVFNKLDLLESDRPLVERARKTLRDRLASIRGTHPHPDEPYVVSAAAGYGIEPMLYAVQKFIREEKARVAREEGRGESVQLPDDPKIRNDR